MKTATILRKEVKINEKDFKKILKRFDVNNFSNRYRGGFTNHIPCPLCEKFTDTCEKCPFQKFEPEPESIEQGCMVVIKSILKNFENYKKDIVIIDDSLEYKNSKGKKHIEKIYKFLIKKFK